MIGSLRSWQRDCLAAQMDVLSNGETEFFTAAGVGSGKTIEALTFYKSGGFDLVCIAAPKTGIRGAWKKDSAAMGLALLVVSSARQLEETVSALCLGSLVLDGLVLTNGLLDRGADDLRMLCQKFRVLAVSDEAHHLGSGMSWSSDYEGAFQDASFRLYLSGTPYRSDDRRVSGLSYEPVPGGHRGVAHYCYPYHAALSDGVVAPVVARFVSGSVREISDNGTSFVYDFADEYRSYASSDRASMIRRRLRVAAVGCLEWQIGAVREARSELLLAREDGLPWAGLIVCERIDQALDISRRIQSEFGDKCMLLVDGADTESCVEQMNSDLSYDWVISITKISEGVSINRLRVGVFLTSTTTRSHFEQMFGRLVRLYPGVAPSDQICQFFVPRDPRLLEYALQSNLLTSHIIQSYGPNASGAAVARVVKMLGESACGDGPCAGAHTMLHTFEMNGAAVNGAYIDEVMLRARRHDDLVAKCIAHNPNLGPLAHILSQLTEEDLLVGLS